MAEAEEELLPSHVRARVLEDHAVVRSRIAELRAAAEKARDGNGAREPFVTAAQTLFEKMREHLALEDEILLPTLETIDAWGPERAKRLAAEHAHQRDVLDMTERELADEKRPIGQTVARMEQFADRLEKDMELEEKTTLNEKLLREFPIPTDYGGA